MKKLVAVLALAAVCVLGVPQNKVISHAETTWQGVNLTEETQGEITYLTYPIEEGKTCCLYKIKVGENADVSNLIIPETIGGLQVTRLGAMPDGDTLQNLFGEYVEYYHGIDGSNALTKKVKQIQIPETVTEIETCCFGGFDNVSSITLPSKLKEVEYNVFFGCNNLESVTLPEALEELRINAFNRCDKLNKIEISEQNTKYTAQKGCIMSKDKKTLYFVYSDKETFKIPSTVTKVESNAFYASNVKKVHISANVKELEAAALYSYQIEDVTVSKKNSCFKKDGQTIYRTSDKSLAVAIAPKGKTYTMSDKVKRITSNLSVIGKGSKANQHEGVRVKTIVLSKNLKYVEKTLLLNSNVVDIVKFQTKVPPKFKDKHAYPAHVKVYVPKNSTKAYKKSFKKYKQWQYVKDNWSEY